MNNSNTDYLVKRLSDIGITYELNKIEVIFEEEEKDREYKKDAQFFEADENGNIIINYFSPYAKVEKYETKVNGKTKILPFTRTRINPDNTTDKNNAKYLQPTKSGQHVFSTPAIIQAYKERKKINTLFVVEGEFKAFAMSNNGLVTFGIGGIHNKKDDERANQLNKYIIDFINVCSVENVILLFDADCFKCEWKEGKDLKTRLSSFLSAVYNFNELIKPYNVTFYFSHIKSEFSETYKGIDDLLYSKNNSISIQTITNELNKFTEGTEQKGGRSDRKYIDTYLITGISYKRLLEVFSIDSVESFYNKYKNELDGKEFVFSGKKYFCDKENKIQIVENDEKKPDAAQFVFICDELFKYQPENVGGSDYLRLVQRKKDVVTMGMSKKDKNNFLLSIEQFDGLTNQPENNPEKYKRVIIQENKGYKSKLLNLYQKINHTAKKGDFPVTERFLKHIFGDCNTSGNNMYEFGLDYLKILYMYPTKKLPILCLVSKQRGTGKSTFLDYLKYIFGENYICIPSAKLCSQFNADFAQCEIVAIDESKIPTDKQEITNNIKQITTASALLTEAKHQNAKFISNYIHLIMCSNEEENFAPIETEETRFCVLKVEPLQEKPQSNFLDLLKKELPYFLYFLIHREFKHANIIDGDRLCFEPKQYETAQLKIAKKSSLKANEQIIYDIIFEQAKRSRQDVFRVSAPMIKKIADMENLNKFNFGTKIINDYLRGLGLKESINPTNIKYYLDIEDGINNGCYAYKTILSRYYTINMNDLLITDEDKEELKQIIYYNEEEEKPVQTQLNINEDNNLPY